MAKYNRQNFDPAPMVAGGAIVANRLCKLHSVEGQIVENAAATTIAYGVTPIPASSGETTIVQQLGRAKVVASEAISIGGLVMGATAGKVAALTGATAYIVGIALTASTADGDIIEVQLLCPAVNLFT